MAIINNSKNKINIRYSKFNYSGNISDNKPIQGEIIAQNERDARKLLLDRKINVIKINKSSARIKRKIKNKDITLFSRQVSTMLKSGIPLLKSLDIVAEGNIDNITMRIMINNIRNDIEQGTSLANALAKYPKYFDKLYCGLIKAGEIAGTLDLMFDNIASYQEKIANIKRKVVGALLYPFIIGIVAIIAVVLMLVVVLPAFKEMYDSAGASLPMITQILITLSNFLMKYGIILLIILAIIGYFFYKSFKKSPKFQKKVDSYLLKIPIFGKIVKNALLARWGRTLSTLLNAGIPLIASLDSNAEAVGNIIYEDSTKIIRSRVAQGDSLTNAMQIVGDNLYPAMFIQMAEVGEESGALDSMLEKAAMYYEEEVENAVSLLSTMIEPFVIVFLGVIIGIMVYAMYAPLFNLGNAF